jgi:hypothetical protein
MAKFYWQNTSLFQSARIGNATIRRYFSDKRYLQLNQEIQNVKQENKILQEEGVNLKMTIEIMKNYIKIQEVINN